MAALSGKFPEKKFKPLCISGCKPPPSPAFPVTQHHIWGTGGNYDCSEKNFEQKKGYMKRKG